MVQKQKIKATQWTSLWKSLGLPPVKRSRLVKQGRDKLNVKSSRPLKKIGVDEVEIQKAISHFSDYDDPLVFYNFSLFFRIAPSTVQYWTGTDDISQAFGKLLRIFIRNPFTDLKTRLNVLHWLNEFNRKGEGWRFQAEMKGRKSVYQINISKFTRLLNKADERFQYRKKAKFRIRNELYLCFIRHAERPINKFVVIRKENDRLYFRISADSKKEVELIKAGLRNHFGVMIDSPERDGNFSKLKTFLHDGASTNFMLTGVSLFQDQYRVSVSPQYNTPLNVAEYGLYQDRLVESLRVASSLVQIRLHYIREPRRKPLVINIRNYRNSDIIGAVLLDINDRKLNRQQRQNIYTDFNKDFHLEFGTFLRIEDLKPREIYERLLQTTMRKKVDYSLRSPSALEIVRGLVKQGLLEWPIKTHDELRYCTSRSCSRSYEAVSSKRYCKTCGETLLPGKQFVVSQLDERRIADFINVTLDNWKFQHVVLKRKVLGRAIHVIEVKLQDKGIQLIPAIKPFNSNQLLLIRLRYEGALLLSSRDDIESLVQSNMGAKQISHFIYDLDNGSARKLRELLSGHASEQIARGRTEMTSCKKRLEDNRTYAAKERVTKNFGAELFEADVSVVLRYMFGNSIWLGARTRGFALPDGMTALPITGGQKGCFLWDAKFGKGQRVRLGNDEKNLKYIKEGRRNETVAANGRLKAMIFVSNVSGPNNFEVKYRRFLERESIGRFKILFLTSKQLLSLLDHYCKFEVDITNNQEIQNQFIESIAQLFFSTAGGKASQVISDAQIETLVEDNEAKFKNMRTPQV